jgi:hypothetical protein
MSRAGPFRPGSVVSLWDIMHEFNAGQLFIAITGLSNAAHGQSGPDGVGMPMRNHDDQKRQIDLVCSELQRIDLPSSLASARELRSIIYGETETNVDIPDAGPFRGEKFVLYRAAFAASPTS